MSKVVTFGEVMLRLTTPGYERFGQARSFNLTFGGAEKVSLNFLSNVDRKQIDLHLIAPER